MTSRELSTWFIAAASTIGIIVRPWRVPEAVWAVLGALCLVSCSLVPVERAWRAVARGQDVYFFLAGMMLSAELARREGVFDWLAAQAAGRARGSATRLFGLVFIVGTFVTIVLSNDATAVVLTPAVYAVAKAAQVEALPYLFICAFVANAASFVLPISNPANLVVFGDHLPPLAAWLRAFAVPSLVAIVATFVALRVTQRRALRRPIARAIAPSTLSRAGRWSSMGIAATAAVLLASSALGLPLGLPTLIASTASVLCVLVRERRAPTALLREVAWSVLPLVAGLFVIVEGLTCTGVTERLTQALQAAATTSLFSAAVKAGVLSALACNLMNNLPAGLIAGSAVSGANLPAAVSGATLIGIDLGPNLSVTGSLATILWLFALRREGEEVGALEFLKLGVVVTLPALALALGVYLLGVSS